MCFCKFPCLIILRKVDNSLGLSLCAIAFDFLDNQWAYHLEYYIQNTYYILVVVVAV